MTIIVRYLLRSVAANRMRTGLIVLAIALSTALLFATSGLSTTIERTYTRVLETEFGRAHIVISADRGSPAPFVSTRAAYDLPDRIEFIASAVSGSPLLLTDNHSERAQMRGMSMSDMESMGPIALTPQLSDDRFVGRVAIVSRLFAADHALAVGDWLRIDLGSGPIGLQIVATAEPVGFFTDTPGPVPLLIPFETASGFAGSGGRATALYIRARSDADRGALESALIERFPRYRVRQTITDEERTEFANTIVIPFRIMLFLVIAVSVYIIFSTFQVITAERLPTIGTFRSVGATQRRVSRVLYGEALLYGLFGAAGGIALGILILRGMTYVAARGFTAHATTATFQASDVFQAALMGVVLPVISAAIPIRRVQRIPVKDVILQLYELSGHRRDRTLIGALMLAAGAVLPSVAPGDQIIAWFFVSLALVFLGTVWVIPFVTRTIAELMMIAYRVVFGNVGRLAAQNLRDNSGIINNIVLLCIGIAGVYLINTISMSVAQTVTNLYLQADFDVEVYGGAQNPTLERRIRSLPEVDDTLGYYVANRVNLPDHGRSIRRVMGIYSDRFDEFWRFDYSAPGSTLLPVLPERRTIIPSYTLRDRFGLQAGDTLSLEFGRRTADYTVIGFVAALWSNGDFAIVDERFLRQDDGASRYAAIYARAATTGADAARAIGEQFGREGVWTRTVAEINARGRQSNSELFFLLRGFSLMAMFLGSIGVVNNFLISFMDRKRGFALLRSIGMSRRQNTMMLLLEAVSVGFIGTLAGLAVAGILLVSIPIVLAAFRVWIFLQYSIVLAGLMFAAGILVSVGGSVGPTTRTRRMNLIEAIKYE
ncbi:MAG: ABC transporter permease [Spirochaetaceae bacterium]|nr:MAG: ABC transporter permease [Spirochaetaceae bacterium]